MNSLPANNPDWLVKKIIKMGGTISFYDFMNFALNDPINGYYGSGKAQLGVRGDFVTSPSLSDDFAFLVGKQIEDWLIQFKNSFLSNQKLAVIELGDTIRVSLTEAPEKEIPVCYSILQSLGLRKTMVEYISCPSCGRTLFNLEEVVDKVRNATSHLTGLDIAIMGCIVNGPGEMADADYGYVGKGKGTIALYRRKEEIKRVPEDEGVNALIQLIKDDGKWIDP